MNRRPDNCWSSSCRPAFTLVEVVASLMLLGTLLVGILVAHRRHAHQVRRAQARLAAVEAADRLLTKWSEEGRWGATSDSGRCEDAEKLVWRWQVVPEPGLSRLNAAMGRLEIMEKDAADSIPLVRLDVLTTAGISPGTQAKSSP
jgi:hypothetical protein